MKGGHLECFLTVKEETLATTSGLSLYPSVREILHIVGLKLTQWYGGGEGIYAGSTGNRVQFQFGKCNERL